MTYETLTLHRISPHVGAEVRDIDITRPLTNRQVEELHRAVGGTQPQRGLVESRRFIA